MFIFTLICCTTCPKTEQQNHLCLCTYKMKYCFLSEFSLRFQGPNAKRKELSMLSAIQGPKLPLVMTNINKPVFNTFGAIFWSVLAGWVSLCRIMVSKADRFFYASPSILEVCLPDWKEETSSSELQLSLACGLKLPTIDKCRQGLHEKSGGLLPVQ